MELSSLSVPQVPHPSLLLYTNVSLTGSGVHLQDLILAGMWTAEEKELHMNILEMEVLQLTPDTFKDSQWGGSGSSE